jgi:hypothetical protein
VLRDDHNIGPWQHLVRVDPLDRADEAALVPGTHPALRRHPEQRSRKAIDQRGIELLVEWPEMYDRRIAPLGQDLLVRELLGDGLDRLAPPAVAVVVDEARREFGWHAGHEHAAQGVDQSWLVRGAGVHANARAHVARGERRVRRRAAQDDAFVVDPVDRDVAEQQVIDGALFVGGSNRYLRSR